MVAIARRTLLRGVPALVLGAAAAKADDAPPVAVTIDNFAFAPQAITVPKGVAVRWTNRDDIPHQVVCTELKLKSAVLDSDQSASFRFERAGTFAYFCGLHPHMTGTVIVTG